MTFTAEPEGVAALRKAVRTHLGLWGLHGVVDEAQLCVSELVSNVVTHVGRGTPAGLAVSVDGARLRIEVHDPDVRALPAVVRADAESEGGRGLALVDAVAERWGVQPGPDGKVTWCELATGRAPTDGDADDPRITRADALLGLYTAVRFPLGRTPGRLRQTVMEEGVIDVITDLLRWLDVHGFDAEDVLDRAQTRFEAQVPGNG
ncbi:hypothetical protein GCM10010389_16770 [Streptomyces echinoruber]|uniref:Histidine kinase/HSP90-like ATPase domain-containing protein n=1 Tax=Streptomyces echinoruber TaxID=68898 RepID=A0A918V8X1_9ACTN|nr:hypothetical protein GCM10010389_16770 [Streptomyces echinoruber]